MSVCASLTAYAIPQHLDGIEWILQEIFSTKWQGSFRNSLVPNGIVHVLLSLVSFCFISHFIHVGSQTEWPRICSQNDKDWSTKTCQKYSVTVIFYYIFHVKPHFLKTLFQSRLLFDSDDFFTNKNRIKCSFTL